MHYRFLCLEGTGKVISVRSLYLFKQYLYSWVYWGTVRPVRAQLASSVHCCIPSWAPCLGQEREEQESPQDSNNTTSKCRKALVCCKNFTKPEKNCVVSVQGMGIRGHLLNTYCGPTLGLLPKGFIKRQRIGAIILWRHRRTLQLKSNQRGLAYRLQTEMPASLN